MSILDIAVPAAAYALSVGFLAGDGAELWCDADPNTFDGVDLAAQLLATPADDPTRDGEPRDPRLAAQRPALLLANTSGRFGVSLGAGHVIEAAGRQYVITPIDGRWTACWSVPAVTYTSGGGL